MAGRRLESSSLLRPHTRLAGEQFSDAKQRRKGGAHDPSREPLFLSQSTDFYLTTDFFLAMLLPSASCFSPLMLLDA